MEQIRTLFAVVLLVLFMYVGAEMFNEKEIIFPEIAALGVGAWFIKNSPWGEKPIYLWLSPTLAAITGVGMLHFLSYPPEILIAGTFILVVLQLCLLRSKVLPSISAAILPILINADSVYYLLSVSILSGIIAIGRGFVNHSQVSNSSSSQLVPPHLKEEQQKFRRETATIYWLKRFVGVVVVATIAFKFKWVYIIAPPLIVTFIEFANPSSPVHQRPVRLLGLILIAALSGTLFVEFIQLQLYWPLPITAGCIVLWMFFLYRQFQFIFPPAAAISLLPTIIPKEMLLLYPFQVAIGAVFFIVIGKIINASKELSKTYSIG